MLHSSPYNKAHKCANAGSRVPTERLWTMNQCVWDLQLWDRDPCQEDDELLPENAECDCDD
jgi:hypothetical protein